VKKVSRIGVQTPDQPYAVYKFHMPTAVGEAPAYTDLPMSTAQIAAARASYALGILRKNCFNKLRPMRQKTIRKALLHLSQMKGINKPYGKMHVGDDRHSTVNSGFCVALLRSVVISPLKQHDQPTILHELAHLAAIGRTDNIDVLVHPETAEYQGIMMSSHGWRRISAPVLEQNGRWLYHPKVTESGGFFFEEAMAELIELSIPLDQHEYREPVTFRGNELIFTIPVTFGHNIAAWSVTLLSKYCPNLIEVLLAGASTAADYTKLRQVVDRQFPGLFDKLYTVQPDDGLALGAEHILMAIDG
jgi:hypothetical protein